MIPYVQIPIPKIFGFQIEAFGILVALGFFLGDYLARKRAEKVGLSQQVIHTSFLFCIFFGIFGAHLVHFLAYEPETLLNDPLSFFNFRVGLSSFGGLLVAGIAIFVYLKWKKIPFLPYADTICFGLLPGWIIGRLGCFTAHDHPGQKSDFFLAVKYPGGARHDLGLYEAMVLACISFALYQVAKKMDVRSIFSGFYFAFCLIAYGLTRFFLDFLRATDLAFSDARYYHLTPAQYFCIFAMGLGLYLMFFFGPKSQKHVQAE
ncbi:MAG: prolipoprotein diacylglyceryl transferase [Bdellovibrionales bacterium]|nr:prolipoprotein diacylglyceryl transferase [Bdellovibrionales bacterium]